MSSLALIAWILGLSAIGGAFYALCAPDRLRRALAQYPRSVWPGRLLLAIDLVWSAVAVSHMHLGGLDSWKVHLWWLTPALIGIGALYLDELLSVRALGGLLLLAASPILALARWHPSAWRLVLSIWMYVWIVAGLFLLLEPWWFRRVALRLQSPRALRAIGLAKGAAGLGLIALAIGVY